MRQLLRLLPGRTPRYVVLGAILFLFASHLYGTNVIIGVIGDFGSASLSAEGAANERAVAQLVKSWRPDFIITVGDNNYPINEASTIDTNIGQFYHEFIHPYRGQFGAGAVSNRFFPCLGNHDWAFGYLGIKGIKPYLDYFTLPGNERYYNHRQGPVEIFCLDSDKLEPDGSVATSRQARWLRTTLATSTATWRLVYFHQPPYSSGYIHGTWTQESTNMIWPFREWGATAILNGHDHLYERIHTNGLPYFIVGTGGDRLDSFHMPPIPGSVVGYNSSHGALRIDATETNLVFRFFNVGRTLIDSYHIESPSPSAKPAQR